MSSNKRYSGVSLLVAMAVAFAALGAAAGALDWPTKAIEVVVPHNPGGENDLHMRRFAKYMEKELGKRIVIVNMAGAGATIGMNNVRAAKPDGYRAICYASAGALAKVIGMINYTLTEAFDIASVHVIDKYGVFVANAKAPYNDIAELVAYAKAHPGEVSFGTEIGGFSHITIAALAELSGAEFNIVDAGTSSEKTTAILGGRLDVIGSQYGILQQYFKNGELKCLGIFSGERQPGAEGVKTFKECGFDMVFDRIFFVGFPKGTDPAIIEKFNQASKRVVENPEYVAECKKNMAEAIYMTPEEAAAYMDATFNEYNKYKDALNKK